MFNHILLALDHPDDPRTLLPHLRRIARAEQARVTVMLSVPFLGTIVEMPAELSPQHHGDEDTAEAFVEALAAHLRSQGIEAEGFTDVGRSALTVGAAAKRIDASLILRALRRPSLVQELFRTSPVPVLAVPVGRRRRSPQVLVPIENAGSLDVIPHAAAMARIFRAGITFVAAEKHEMLPRARDVAQREWISTEVTLVADDLASTLLELTGVLMVMRSPSPEMATRLIRESKVPLLVVRRPPPLPEFDVPIPIESPTRLRSRRVPFNPLEGIGEP